jgi:hypothetical protein
LVKCKNNEGVEKGRIVVCNKRKEKDITKKQGRMLLEENDYIWF